MQRTGIALLVVGLVAIAAAYVASIAGIAPELAPWWLANGTTAVLAGMAVLGAARHGKRTPILTAAIIASFTSVAVGLLVPLAMPAPDASAPLLLGLPRPTAILLLLVGLVPLVMLPLAYAVAFPREVIADEGHGP